MPFKIKDIFASFKGLPDKCKTIKNDFVAFGKHLKQIGINIRKNLLDNPKLRWFTLIYFGCLIVIVICIVSMIDWKKASSEPSSEAVEQIDTTTVK